jgi:DNA-nicking Smr family endonuclease
VLDYLTELVSGRAEFDLTYSDEYVEGRLKSLPSKVMNDLRGGKIPTQDYLDLHGLTLSQAEQAIVKFVLNSVGLRRRCLLLVHGRGHRSQDGIPILKHNLENLLLRYPIKKHILAFTTARPVDGGAGACYILLRR